MTQVTFDRIDSAIADDRFPDVDVALRRGRHIDSQDIDAYEYLDAAHEVLVDFYKRYGCQLVRATAGFFYLVPLGDRLGRHHLTPGEMIVGQGLALLLLDPASIQGSGVVPRRHLAELLISLLGEAKLFRILHPRSKWKDEKVAQEKIREEIDRALRALHALGFIDLREDDLRLRDPLLRFADAVSGLDDEGAALRRLIARGEAATGTASAADGEDER